MDERSELGHYDGYNHQMYYNRIDDFNFNFLTLKIILL